MISLWTMQELQAHAEGTTGAWRGYSPAPAQPPLPMDVCQSVPTQHFVFVVTEPLHLPGNHCLAPRAFFVPKSNLISLAVI